MFLQENVAGVTPSPIAGPGYLDALDLKSETFTVVGYGTDAFITGSAVSPTGRSRSSTASAATARSPRSPRTTPSPTGS